MNLHGILTSGLGLDEAASILEKIQVWLDHCARNIELLTPEAYVEHGNFWENMPGIIEAILRRKYELPPVELHPIPMLTLLGLTSQSTTEKACCLLSANFFLTL